MFTGSIVALVTPFKKNMQVNEERLRFLINWHIKNKTDAILVCGTTGESATLTHDEHKRVIKVAVEEAKGKIPIIAGAGSNSTQEALDLAEFARRVKANAILVITPYYNKPTQEGLYWHYKKIAIQVKLPLIIYNVPSRTGINIFPETVVRLYKECKSIIGIKEASGNLDQITKLMSLVDRKFLLLSGSDELTLPIMSVGGKGVISVLANIMPKETHSLVESFLKGNLEKAKKLQLELYPLIKALFIETNPIPVKTALGAMGLIDPILRLPLCKMRKENEEKLINILKNYNLIS
ncbi:MAG: 4-hydroxy-tetrahydrodipicolinate synthase [Candidatus Omnitrophota bacterium]|nr:MAG: 4-hydroxy-tetrahydrodipicolinate synthase [Candidatus Omnitrophota bacterium]RKY46291.1 MAG: 4-hydroxy-tetrahydrodipicolinate synthase [Candidatus Omnitrophota bacterium]HDN86575.1 4-hydroxy-tetrahydrodipicolinate synthase [Candidatus Omnitrophota bacterium]